MSEYNIQINKFNALNSTYDQLYPVTKIGNVTDYSPVSTSVICTIAPILAGVTVTLTGDSVYSAVTDSSGVATMNDVSLGTYTITFNNPDVSTDTPTLEVQFYGVYNVAAVYKPLVTYTVIIDETNSNPLTCCTYGDDAVGMTKGSSVWDNMEIFNSIKPCVFQNGAVNYYLNPNNYTQKADGSTATITGADGDVMVEFSKFAYRIYRSGTNLYVTISNNPDVIAADSRFSYGAFSRNGLGDRNYMYIGAYHGYTISSALKSVSGQLPTAKQTIGTFRTQAQANGTGYQQFTFYQLTALQCLFIIRYGNLNSQQALGMGYINADAAASTGATNTNGMYFGSTSTVKFAGIEDFWGNVYDWIDGLFNNSSRHIMTSYKSFNNSGSGYTDNGQCSTSDLNGYISQAQGTTNTGFIPKLTSGSNVTFFADSGVLGAGALPVFGGAWGNGSGAGAFPLYVDFSAFMADSDVGARLSYC